MAGKGKFAALFGAVDMTQGNPMSNLVKFSVPLLIGNLAQQLYSTVDTLIVGRYAADGDASLAAIGASFPVINLLLVLFMGVSMGASVMASQYFGARDRDQLSATVGTTITATFVTTVVVMVISPFFCPWMMSLLNTPARIYDKAVEYMVILLVGFLGSAYYNVISGVLRGLGDSVMPVVFLLVATGINIVLDIVFVKYMAMDVAGAAYATIISQFISGALCLVRLLRMTDQFKVTLRTLIPRKKLVFQLIHLGLPSGITQAIFSLAMLIVQSITNDYGNNNVLGTAIITANTVVMRVDGFAMMPTFTFGTAMTTFAGQNIGAGQLDRTVKGTKSGLILGLSVSVVLVGLILLFGPNLLMMFTKTPEVIAIGQTMLTTLAVGYIAMAVTQILSGVMRGAGDTMTPMWISLITTVAIRLPVVYILEFVTRPQGGLRGSGDPMPLYLSMLISWVLGAVMTAIAYKLGRWKKKSIVAATTPAAPVPEGDLELTPDDPNATDTRDVE